MKDGLKVSVIIPVYNYGKYLGEALDSVLNQTYKCFEIIIIDDGSTDNTKDVAESYVKKYPGVIKYRLQQNGGVSKARNNGIRNSQGAYIALLDADDIWFPDKLETQLTLFEKDRGIGLVCCSTFPFDTNGDHPDRSTFILNPPPGKGNIFHLLFTNNFISTNTVIIRRECFDNVGFFDESLWYWDDYDMWLRVSNSYKVDYTETVLAKFRLHGNRTTKITAEREEKLVLDSLRVRQKAFDKNSSLLGLLSSKLLHDCYYQLYLNCANYYFRFGLKDKARKHILIYINYYPYNVRAYILLIISFLPALILRLIWKLKRSLYS